jgi:7-cyano-7-deazaguanine reductase
VEIKVQPLAEDFWLGGRCPLRKHRSMAKQRSKSQSDTRNLTLLGGGPLPQLSSPEEAVLETFESPSKRDYEVTFSTNEFTSHCPVTGQPDFAEIVIRYTPDRRCIESKSLKQYLGAYRNQAVFAEGITNRILDDVVRAISPRRALVIGDFSPRGGIGIRVEAIYEGSKAKTRSR